MTDGRSQLRAHRWLIPVYWLYTLWIWAEFACCVLLAIGVALLVPGFDRRCRWLQASAKLALTLAGVPVTTRGLENLPPNPCVLVANHASYIDGILLKALLPARFSFVIKGEMRNIALLHLLLRRSGSRFVERYDATGSARDARSLVKAARAGESLVLFPEGTFIAEPGVSRFRAGAFVAAAQAQAPIVPVAISGTRAMLPAGRVMIKPAALAIDVLAPITVDDPCYAHSRTLAEAARQGILAVLAEPDLVPDSQSTDIALQQ